MGPWLIPILAAVAGSVASAGASKMFAGDPAKPQQMPGKLGSIQQSMQGQQMQDPMADDILQQYLASAQGRKAAGYGAV